MLTLLALGAFAANSILCRLALGAGAIDAASYSAIRLAAGAAVLLPLAFPRERARRRPAGSWLSAACLFAYAVPFSFAYRTLSAGTGALILFASVQMTMIAVGVAAGERPGAVTWGGLALSLAGLGWLVSPGVSAPSLGGALLMSVAGAAWGAYSLRGRGSKTPLADTAGNFLRAALPGAVIAAVLLARAHATPRGAILAVVSGAVTSGGGYAIWYAALPYLSAARAAIVQLAVPVITAAAGIALLGEQLTLRFVLASAAILGGVAAALGKGSRVASPPR